jgi:hypothetical protein
VTRVNNVRREDMGDLVGEVSRKAKKCKRDFELEHLVMLTRRGNLTRRESLRNFAKPSRLVGRNCSRHPLRQSRFLDEDKVLLRECSMTY